MIKKLINILNHKLTPVVLLMAESLALVYLFILLWFQDTVQVTEPNPWIRALELATFTIILIYSIYLYIRSVF